MPAGVQREPGLPRPILGRTGSAAAYGQSVTTTLPSDDVLYEALTTRDESYEGRAYVAVRTTGIFCRLTCPARSPKPENCLFLADIGQCLAAGFRPCLRCRPLVSAAAEDRVVAQLVAAIEADPGRRWSEQDLVERGLDPSTVRRAFRRHLGATFLQVARVRRLRHGAAALTAGEPVIDAQIGAGFDSASGFRDALARVLGASPSALCGPAVLGADWVDTPLGPMIAVADDERLHLLEFFDQRTLPAQLAALRATVGSIGIGSPAPVASVRDELTAYFSGASTDFLTPVAVASGAFTREVHAHLRTIPPGTTRSYAQVAADLGRPSAVRAVARANATNPLAILVPCHRVVATGGALTGYAGGVWRKRWLLEHERQD